MGIFPSIYGLIASTLFLVLAYAIWIENGVAIFTQFDSASDLIESASQLLGFTCLGIGYLLRYAPKFLLLYFLNFIAHPMTIAGGLLLVVHFFLRLDLLA